MNNMTYTLAGFQTLGLTLLWGTLWAVTVLTAYLKGVSDAAYNARHAAYLQRLSDARRTAYLQEQTHARDY